MLKTLRRVHAVVLIMVTLFALALPSAFAVVPIDHAVQLSAATQVSPPKITLTWAIGGSPTGYTIYRRAFEAALWSQVATYTGTATGYTDTNVAVGAKYEYQVVRMGVTTAYGYLLSGIQASLTDNRGKVILLVDNTMSVPLQSEINRLIWDLRGDGWQVIRHTILRTDTPAQMKAVIQADYMADPTHVKSVFILGHLPMFMSGPMAPDGHSARPWPADEYYGDMDGAWTANSTTSLPSPLELQVGRVDLWNLPALTLPETELLRQYLNKDHNYRQKTYAIQQNAIVEDGFGEFSGEAFAQNGWRNFAPFVGAANISAGSWLTPVSTPHLWVYGCGSGEADKYGGTVTTAKMNTADPGVFTFAFGSIFGQWDVTNDLLRGVLGSPHYTLTCAWAGRPNWFVHQMALGETIGYSAMKTQNNQSGEYSSAGSSSWQVHVALMGDPTLRAFMVAPATGPTATVSAAGSVTVSWSASADSIAGCNVYRSDNENGPYTSLTANPIGALTYLDPSPAAGDHWYMVRPVALTTTPSGTFYNAGQGVFAHVYVPFTDIPTDGITLWLKAGDASTDPVSTWPDASPGANSLTQSSPQSQPRIVTDPLNSLPAVHFDGADMLTTATRPLDGSTEFTTFIFARPDSNAAAGTLLWNGDATAAGGYGLDADSSSISAGWGSASSVVAAPANPGKWSSISTQYDGALAKIWINGASYGAATKIGSGFSQGAFSLGDYAPAPGHGFTGSVSELLIYSSALSDTDRARVKHYLTDKYGHPTAGFTMPAETGLVPFTATFDASSSVDPDGAALSYVWDFGDDTTATGVTASHTYSTPATYSVSLKVTDGDGYTSTSSQYVTAMPTISATSLSASPVSPQPPGTNVTLTAGTTGGYLVLYKFLVNDGSGWQVVRDFDASSTYLWTPDHEGVWQFQVESRSSDSPLSIDSTSPVLYYTATGIPTAGLSLWLRSDTGVGAPSAGLVTSWTDLSSLGNSVSQVYTAYSPTLVQSAFLGRPVVRYSAPESALTTYRPVLTGSTDFTTFTVARTTSPGPGTKQYVWSLGNATQTGGYGVYFDGAGKITAAWGGTSSLLASSAPALAENWYTITSAFSGGNHQMWVGDSLIGSIAKSGSNLSYGIAIGNDYATSAVYGLTGDLGEILIYNRRLSDSEIAAVRQYLSVKWATPAAVSVDRISQARALQGGTPVTIASSKTALTSSTDFYDGSYYIGEQDRTCGMRVVGGTVNRWDNITLSGIVDFDANGEKIIRLQSMNSKTPGSEIRPLGMANSSVQPTGQLVKVWGKVLDMVDDYIIISDGGQDPVYVDVADMSSGISMLIDYDYYITAVGIACPGPDGHLAVKTRSESDLAVIAN